MGKPESESSIWIFVSALTGRMYLCTVCTQKNELSALVVQYVLLSAMGGYMCNCLEVELMVGNPVYIKVP